MRENEGTEELMFYSIYFSCSLKKRQLKALKRLWHQTKQFFNNFRFFLYFLFAFFSLSGRQFEDRDCEVCRIPLWEKTKFSRSLNSPFVVIFLSARLKLSFRRRIPIFKGDVKSYEGNLHFRLPSNRSWKQFTHKTLDDWEWADKEEHYGFV